LRALICEDYRVVAGMDGEWRMAASPQFSTTAARDTC
jgi:hypothetical protein